MADDAKWMGRALELADCAGREHEVPIGAVLVKDNVENRRRLELSHWVQRPYRPR